MHQSCNRYSTRADRRRAPQPIVMARLRPRIQSGEGPLFTSRPARRTPLLTVHRRTPFARDDADDREVEHFGEFEVTLVMCRHGHDCAGAVLRQHVVGNPDGDGCARAGLMA